MVAQGDALSIPTGVDAAAITVQAQVTGADGVGTLNILDQAGNVVGTRSLGNVSAGQLTPNLGSAATGLAPGNYHFSVTVTNAAGQVTQAVPYTTGKVDSVRSTANGPVLICGAFAIPFANVVEIKN